MENLIGDDVLRIGDIATGAAAVHLYGKREIKAGRKMGHVNRVMIGGLSARR
jgi:5-(carboxyamino)imidazole ribonucleotide synthase